MAARDPILPENALLPSVLWLGVLLVVMVVSVLHAAHRRRAAWAVGMVLAAPVSVVAYWAVELTRLPGPNQKR